MTTYCQKQGHEFNPKDAITELMLSFQERFKKVVYLKGKIKESSQHISRLHVWDKGGSHEDAINIAVENLNEIRGKYKTLLRGMSYEQWKEISIQVSKVKSKLKSKSITEDKIFELYKSILHQIEQRSAELIKEIKQNN